MIRRSKNSRKSVAKRDERVSLAVRNYVNRTLLTRPSSVETKWCHIGYQPIAVGSGQVYALNLTYFIPQGVTQDSRLGLDVSDVTLHLDVQYSHFGCSVLGTGKTSASNFRVITFTNPSTWRNSVNGVIEVPTAGTGVNIPVGSVFIDSGVDRMTHSFLNKDINSILDDSGQHRVQSSSAPTGAAWSSVGFQGQYRKTVKLGDLRWESNSLSYLRDVQVFVWVVADYLGYTGIGPSINDNLGQFSVNTMLTYHDS